MITGGWWLFAESGFHTTFEWGRLQTPTDFVAPCAAALAMLAFVWTMYRRDSVELHPAVGLFLTGLRTAAVAGLLVVYLKPQWRNETDQVQNSRVLLLADTSLSMAQHDHDASPVPAEPSRAQQIVAALSQGAFLHELRKKHDVYLYRFDQDSTLLKRWEKLPPEGSAVPAPRPADEGEPAFDWDRQLAPQGTETRLGKALRDSVEADRGQPVAGIVLFTDGQHNAGLDPEAVVPLARAARIAIYPVGIGSLKQPVNVRIAELRAPDRAYPGDRYTVSADIQAQGLAGQTATVELYSRDAATPPGGDDQEQLERSEQITLGGDGELVPVKFDLTPKAPGRRTLRLRIRPSADDREAGDNEQEADVEIVDHKTQVLLFAGGPSREYQFLRNQLRRDQSMVVDVLLQTGAEGMSQDARQILDEFPDLPEELFAYDVLVAIDPDWRRLSADQQSLVERWVSEQAGGLIAVAGPIYTDPWVQAAAAVRIRNLYPVEFHRRFSTFDDGRYGSKEPWRLEFTRDGAQAEFLWIADSGPASRRAWEEFPGVYGYHAVRGPKRGATVYARYSDPRASEGGQLPVYMAGQFYGAGRVFYLGSGEMWRLRSLDEAYFERFYTKLLRYVSNGRLRRSSPRGVLRAGDRFLVGGTVDVQAQLYNARLEPLLLPRVPLEILLPDSTSESIQLAADTSLPGSYRGQFTVRKEGGYRLELVIPESKEERLTHQLRVSIPDLERQHPQRNDALLSKLAEKTGGVYYVGLESALGMNRDVPSLIQTLRDQSRTTTTVSAPTPLWDNKWTMWLLCGVLCLEWLIRRLSKLA